MSNATITAKDVQAMIAATRAPCQLPPRWIANRSAFARIRTAAARSYWAAIYRAARTLGDRQLAFAKVGDQRKGFGRERGQ